MSSNVTFSLNIPFQTPKQAIIAKEVMEADSIVKQSAISVDYLVEEESKNLVVNFSAESNRILRTIVNSSIESLKSVIECFDEFDPDLSQDV